MAKKWIKQKDTCHQLNNSLTRRISTALIRALLFHSENNKAQIAQLVEQRIENPCVPGSIPGLGTISLRGHPKCILDP